jgi:aerotolerance regulator-like protein/VWA domain-containing protein/CARDB protein
MGFLAPAMLWGAAAASIPIALHFFFRSRYRTVPWAAMKFLLTSIEQTSRRLRFQELLLLLARIMVLVLLALALARPMTTASGGAGKGDAVDAVFLIDTSYSMGAMDGAATRLGRAQAAAQNVIDQLPPHSTVQIITCSDRSVLLGPRSPSNLDHAKDIVKETALSHLASDLVPGLAEAVGAIERGQASNKEFYLFSDMHKLGFEQQGSAVVKTLQEIKKKAAVYFVRCGRSKPKNVAVIGITPQSGIPRPGERVGFAVLVKNTGTEPVRDLKVSLMVDDNARTKETQAVGTLGPGETRAVTLTGKLDKAGLRILTALAEYDDLEADNRFDQVILVRDQVNVLLVDGANNEKEPEKSAGYYLEHALMPVKEADKAKYYLQIQKVSPRLASPARLANQDLCILVNVGLKANPKQPAEILPADFDDELAKFVREGHGLMIFAGDHVQPEPYNKVLGDDLGLLPLKIKGFLDAPVKSPLLVNRNSVGLPAFWKFKEDDYYKNMDFVEVYRSLELEEPSKGKEKEEEQEKEHEKENDKGKSDEFKKAPKAKQRGAVHVVMRYANGRPAVASREVGAGEVMLFATSADPGFKADSPNPTWTNWPKEPMYVPFMDVALSHLLHGQTQTYNLIAGQTLRWYPKEKEEKAYSLLHPDGRLERLGLPQKVRGQKMVTATDLSRAGIYHILATAPPRATEPEAAPPDAAQAKEKGIPLAVIPDLRESENLDTLTAEQLDDRLGFRAIHVIAGDNTTTFSEVERFNREWTMWILALVLFVFLGEGLLAWWCGKAW